MNISKKDTIHTIAYFLDYGKYFGGAANTLLQQAVLMKKAGCATTIFLSDYYGRDMEPKYEKICTQYGIKILYETFQISSQPEDIDIICLDENYDTVKEKIQEIAPDILHSVQINPMVELIGRELSIPHIMNIYPLLPDFFSLHYIDVFPQYHICDSWYWAKRWAQYLNTDYTCIRTTVNMKAYDKHSFALGTTVKYICVGDIYENKNQLNVIKAFQIALNEGIRGTLSIWGHDGRPYADECKNYIKSNDLAEYITIEGFGLNMEEIYKNSDVLICGSRRESYPNVISEAIASGVIVISTPVAGVPEIIRDGINGYLSDDYTAEGISRKILEYNNDIGKSKLQDIRKNTYETFMKNHSPDVVTEKLIRYYSHVIQSDKRKTSIMIKDIRKIFSIWKEVFYQKYDCFSESKMVALKLWYLYYITPVIERAVQKGSVFYIWGTGKYGTIVKEMVEVFLSRVVISGFMDSNRNGTFWGYTIYDPKEILEEDNIVVFVAAVNGQQEIIRQLEDNNKVFNSDYFILSARSW